MNLDIKAGSVPRLATFHLSTISRHPRFEHSGNLLRGDPKINVGSIYSQLMNVIYSKKHIFWSALCFSHLPDYGSSSEGQLSEALAGVRDNDSTDSGPNYAS